MARILQLLLTGWLAALATGCGPDVTRSAVTESDIFGMKQVYKSMFGPGDRDMLTLLSTEEPEVLWVTAIEAEIVGKDGETPESPAYFCHSSFINTQNQPRLRRQLLGPRLGRARKMFTLVQGLTEVRFPEGFAMPVLSNDEFESQVMVMNPSAREEPIYVGVDSRIEYVRDADLDKPMKPLFVLPLVARVPVVGEDADHSLHEHEHEGDSCLSTDADATAAMSVDREGHTRILPLTTSSEGVEMTGHWYVPPGRHVYRHRLDPLARRLPFDTRAHYIYAHLHPYGESLELIDRTTGESVFEAVAHNYPDQIAVERITHYASAEGIPIHRDHEYEIVATYDNTTDGDVDSMAVIYLYLHDRNPVLPGRRPGA